VITHAPSLVAERLLAARRDGVAVSWMDVLPASREDAFAAQTLQLQSIGPIGGWKVGAKHASAEPSCAPLPAGGILSSRAVLQGPAWRMRGIEVELAVRFGRDLEVYSPPSAEDLRQSLDAVLPAVEVVETRLSDWAGSDSLAQLADLQSHGALVLGDPQPVPADLDLRTVVAYLAADGQPLASARGGNPAADLWRMLGWLAVHCTWQGRPLRAGQVVTTGSCTGMLYVDEGTDVQAELQGVGQVLLQL